MIELHLPLPPSANGIWRNVRGRTLASKKYREWKTEALWTVSNQLVLFKCAKFSENCRVEMEIRRPRKNADLDNRIKPLLDVLETAGIIENDNRVVELSAKWADVEGAVVRVEPIEG